MKNKNEKKCGCEQYLPVAGQGLDIADDNIMEERGAQYHKPEVKPQGLGNENVKKPEEDNKKPQDALSAAQGDIKSLNEQIKRMQADFENYKGRLQREAEQNRKYAAEKIISQLLPLLDNLERAVNSAQDGTNIEALKTGIGLIYKQMRDILEKEGLKEIACLGKEYDPNFAEVLMCEDNSEYPEDAVTDVLEKGYIFKDNVIRPAKVKVCKRKEASD